MTPRFGSQLQFSYEKWNSSHELTRAAERHNNPGLMNLSRIGNATVAATTPDVSAAVLVLGVLVLSLGLLLGSSPAAG